MEQVVVAATEPAAVTAAAASCRRRRRSLPPSRLAVGRRSGVVAAAANAICRRRWMRRRPKDGRRKTGGPSDVRQVVNGHGGLLGRQDVVALERRLHDFVDAVLALSSPHLQTVATLAAAEAVLQPSPHALPAPGAVHGVPAHHASPEAEGVVNVAVLTLTEHVLDLGGDGQDAGELGDVVNGDANGRFEQPSKAVAAPTTEIQVVGETSAADCSLLLLMVVASFSDRGKAEVVAEVGRVHPMVRWAAGILRQLLFLFPSNQVEFQEHIEDFAASLNRFVIQVYCQVIFADFPI